MSNHSPKKVCDEIVVKTSGWKKNTLFWYRPTSKRKEMQVLRIIKLNLILLEDSEVEKGIQFYRAIEHPRNPTPFPNQF